jgi:hypothetical protein
MRLFAILVLLSVTILRAETAWTDLLAGDSLAAWRTPHDDAPPVRGWTVRDGVLTIQRPATGESRAGGDIITRARYASFEFETEFRMTPGCNGGIKFLVQTGPTPLGSTVGPEFQILDDARHPDARGGRDGNRTLGSLYDLLPAAAGKRVKPMGEWNHARIVVRGAHVEFWLNGSKTLEFDRSSTAFRETVAQSKYHVIPGFAGWSDGHLLLQDHGDEVSFRHLRIRSLAAP